MTDSGRSPSGRGAARASARQAAQKASFLDVFARGFSLPLLGVFAIAGGLFGWATRPPAEAAAAADPADPADPAPDGPPGVAPLPVGGATPADVEERLRAGELDTAYAWARRSGHAELAARAYLLRELAAVIEPSPIRAAETLVRAEAADGAVYLGAPVPGAQGADLIVLACPDGSRAELTAAEVVRTEELGPDAGRRALEVAIRSERSAMGPEPSGLAIHHLAHQAFACGLGDLGVELLEEALATREGPILIDMFGTGDVERLHTCRRAVFGAALADEPTEAVDLASLPDEDPAPTPDPSEPAADVTPPSPPPPPAAEPTPSALEQDPMWQEANDFYRRGTSLYRRTFGASIRDGAPQVKAALREFREAQDLLDALVDAYAGADRREIERRLQELNSLVLDCTKRLGAYD